MQTKERKTAKTALANDIDFERSTANERYLKKYVREVLLPQRFVNYGRIKKLPKVIGLVGPWGSGKSLSGSGMTILDYMLDGITVYSNMEIHFFIRIGDMVVGYASQPLNRADMFKLQIGDALLYIDEVNIEFAEARRAMTNKNLKFSKVLQMIRKKHCSLIYTVINEMFIEQRLREMTSMFIKCNDVLLQPGGLSLPFDFGERIHWRGFDMMGILGKGSYYDVPGKEPTFELTVNGKAWWNTYETDLVQGEDIENYSKFLSIDKDDVEFESRKNPATEKAHQDWEWLERIAEEMLNDGRAVIPAEEVHNRPDVIESGLSKNAITKELRERFHIESIAVTRNNRTQRAYRIDAPVLV